MVIINLKAKHIYLCDSPKIIFVTHKTDYNQRMQGNWRWVFARAGIFHHYDISQEYEL